MAIPRLATLILILALAGALASFLGPHERWWGLDVGRLGATVFGLTLWAGAALFAAYPERIFPIEWSIAERRAWAGLFFVLMIFVAYVRFMGMLGAMPATPTELGELPSGRFIWNLTVLLIAWAVVSATIRGRDPDVIESDERDQRLRRGADRAGDWMLTTLVAWCVGLLIAQPAERLAWWLAPQIAANVLIGILIVKTLVEHAYLVGRYAWDRR
jgi:hypothetical protein